MSNVLMLRLLSRVLFRLETVGVDEDLRRDDVGLAIGVEVRLMTDDEDIYTMPILKKSEGGERKEQYKTKESSRGR